MKLKKQSEVVSKICLFRDWERANLPLYGTSAGYELFLLLASSPYTEKVSLKKVYLSMRCAESTTRLLFRNLGSDGWIVLPRGPTDSRFREFQLTDKLKLIIKQWSELFESSIKNLK
jgi:hypothetical protein